MYGNKSKYERQKTKSMNKSYFFKFEIPSHELWRIFCHLHCSRDRPKEVLVETLICVLLLQGGDLDIINERNTGLHMFCTLSSLYALVMVVAALIKCALLFG